MSINDHLLAISAMGFKSHLNHINNPKPVLAHNWSPSPRSTTSLLQPLHLTRVPGGHPQGVGGRVSVGCLCIKVHRALIVCTRGAVKTLLLWPLKGRFHEPMYHIDDRKNTADERVTTKRNRFEWSVDQCCLSFH